MMALVTPMGQYCPTPHPPHASHGAVASTEAKPITHTRVITEKSYMSEGLDELAARFTQADDRRIQGQRRRMEVTRCLKRRSVSLGVLWHDYATTVVNITRTSSSSDTFCRRADSHEIG